MENNEIYNAINQTLAILEHNFKYTYGKKISYEEIFEMMKDLYVLFTNFEENVQKCGELAIKRYIPLLDLLVSIDNNTNHLLEYNKQLKYAYKISARVSLEHYMVYREWEQPEKEKLFETRYNILIGYIHYLQELECNPHFLTLVFNCPSGYGKTYPKKISEAWSFGIDDKGAFLSLCSNDDVVKSGSRAVIDEMKSDEFGEVFPKLKWNEENKDYFLKETDEKWKLKNCRLPFSYYAKTTQSNVVGSRASKSIHIDDLYPDFKEAMNQVLNKYYYDKSITVWEKRYVQNKPPKVCITGTLWASGDYIDQKIQQLEREHKFKPHPKYPYTRISEDGSCAIIQVPALDYETGESTCPELKSTQELLKEKNNMEEYLWETNFQQKSTNPESLSFSYDKLRTYETIPETDYKGAYSVIDATRKSGKDFFAMPIFKKVENDGKFDYYLKDALFTRTATKDMYYQIVDKIIEHHIILLVIESNVTSELKQNIEKILKEKNADFCEIIEKYNTIPKATRIENEKHIIKKQLVFPKKGMYGINMEVGKFMDNLTTYNSTGTNANDDACFEKGTMIATQFGNIPIEKIKKGMKVITPFGLKEVEECGITGIKETINKFGLNVTKNHKVFSKRQHKFIPIDKLTLYEESDILSMKGIILWKKKLLNLMEEYTKDILKANTILNIQPRTKVELADHNYTEQYGNITMEKYQKGIKFIIKTIMLIIMTSLTWNVYQLGNIYHNILKKIGKIKNTVKECLNKCKVIVLDNKNAENGIKVKKAENGIDNMQKTLFLKINLKKKEFVNFVKKNILHIKTSKSIAQKDVNTKELIYKNQKYVRYVEKHILALHTNQKLVQENAKIVYNLKVKDAGCYYANGILVSNCDSAALFSSEIIEEGSSTQKAVPLDFVRKYM